MDKKKRRSKRKIDKNESDKQKEKRLIEEEKAIVKKQINDLTEVITNIELELGLVSYEEIKIVSKSSPNQKSSTLSVSQNEDIDDILEYELFKMSGFYCSKVTDHEYVFNFSSSSNIKSPYAIQILIKEQEIVELKAWVMPWGIDIDKITSETPLEKTKDIVPFLRHCKRIIDCHAERKNQFDELKEYTSSIGNIKIDASLGYTQIFCHFLNIHDNSSDKKFNLIAKLYYGVGRARPSAINIEWNLKEQLTQPLIIKMKTFVKYFKNKNLLEAFQNITEKTHPIYDWKPEKYNDSILMEIKETENDSNANESEDESEYTGRRKSKRVRRRKRPAKSPDVRVSNDNTDKSDRSLDISNNKTQEEQKKLSPPKRGKSQKEQTITKFLPKNPEPKPQQSKQLIKETPVNKNKNKNVKHKINNLKKKAITSTPMVMRSGAHHQTSIVESLGMSPIVEK